MLESKASLEGEKAALLDEGVKLRAQLTQLEREKTVLQAEAVGLRGELSSLHEQSQSVTGKRREGGGREGKGREGGRELQGDCTTAIKANQALLNVAHLIYLPNTEHSELLNFDNRLSAIANKRREGWERGEG